MENKKWKTKMENGKWKMENGKWKNNYQPETRNQKLPLPTPLSTSRSESVIVLGSRLRPRASGE
jgi:hypothetical protein